MKINTNSVCLTCQHFEHECYADGDYGCMEWCKSSNDEIRERFYYEDEISECKEFVREY